MDDKPKPNSYAVTYTNGRTENVECDDADKAPVLMWVFKKDGKVVRQIPADEISEAKPQYPPTPEEWAAWNRKADEINQGMPKLPRLHRPK